MFKLAAAAGIATAFAQAPAKPTWPNEFTATIAHTDAHNRTDTTQTTFSVSNNAIIDVDKDPQGNSFEIFNDWANKVNYFVTPQVCHEAPARGSIQDRIPDLRAVVYNGTSTFNGLAVYVWDDHRDVQYLTTQDANQYPVAFTDRRAGFTESYSDFKAVPTWPAGTFGKPAGCK